MDSLVDSNPNSLENSINKKDLFEFPIGYSPKGIYNIKKYETHPDKVYKKSWNIALEPLQSLVINALMLWLSGNKISIFPIMLIVMNFIRHLKALIGLRSSYDQLMGNYKGLQILVFFLGHCLGIFLLFHKCVSIGLLRFGPDEWASYSLKLYPYERVYFGILKHT